MTGEIYSFCIVPTTRCNLKCAHCYTYDVMSRYHTKDMDVDTARKVVDGLYRFFEEVDNFNVSIPIVGGEPLLADFKVVKTLVENLFEKIGKRNRNFSIFFNTNLLNLNGNYLSLFKDFNMSICASYDPGGIRFKTRKELHTFEKNLIKLANTIPERVYLAVTVCEPLLKFDLYEYVSTLGVKNVMLSEFSPLGNAVHNLDRLFKNRKRIALTLIAFSEIRPDSVNVYFTKEDVLREYQSFRSGFGGGVECWNDCFNTFSILPDGGVTFAGFCFSTEIIGNIIHDSAEAILSHPERIRFMMRKTTHHECIGCEYVDFCRCGCVSLSKIEDDTDCPGLKTYLDYVFKNVIPEEYPQFIEETWFKKYA